MSFKRISNNSDCKNKQTDKNSLTLSPSKRWKPTSVATLLFSAAVFVFCLMKCGANVWQKDQLKANWVKLNGKWGKFWERWSFVAMCYHNLSLSLSLCFINVEKGKRSLAFEPSALNNCFLERKLIFREAYAWNNSAKTKTFTWISCSCSTGLECVPKKKRQRCSFITGKTLKRRSYFTARLWLSFTVF